MNKKKPAGGRKGRPTASRSSVWVVAAGAVVLVVAIIGAIILLQGSGNSNALPATITTDEAVAKRNAGAFILDVREPSEWADYHVPGSTLIPLGSLASRVSEAPRDRDVVVVCHSGNRSQSGRDILLKAGFTRVTSMAGGLQQWQSKGYPLVSGQ
ncbi:MAG: rhodanese-like domain-containing protein [Chloroflexi bacterium]|nr:rhodanese-like domain-containing protein [Chloroflexota bacterium]MCL5276036.1 rhodanese-like domain-containing protein [Chloroflexota bacterium]